MIAIAAIAKPNGSLAAAPEISKTEKLNAPKSERNNGRGK
jgi:hypothetical protein